MAISNARDQFHADRLFLIPCFVHFFHYLYCNLLYFTFQLYSALPMISIKIQFFLAIVLLEPKVTVTEAVLKCGIMQFRGYIKTKLEKGFLLKIICMVSISQQLEKTYSFHTNNKKLKTCNR